jgi:hypothetical protein
MPWEKNCQHSPCLASKLYTLPALSRSVADAGPLSQGTLGTQAGFLPEESRNHVACDQRSPPLSDWQANMPVIRPPPCCKTCPRRRSRIICRCPPEPRSGGITINIGWMARGSARKGHLAIIYSFSSAMTPCCKACLRPHMRRRSAGRIHHHRHHQVMDSGQLARRVNPTEARLHSAGQVW